MKHLLVALMLLTLLPQPAQAAQPDAIRVVIVIPAGYPMYASESAMIEYADKMAHRTQAWLKGESGLTFRYTVEILYESRTLAELSAGAADTCGDGLSWAMAHSLLLDNLKTPLRQPTRTWLIVVGAGGFAGGDLQTSGNYAGLGYAVLGDWGMQHAFTGRVKACNPWAPSDGWVAFAHEAMNSFGLRDGKDIPPYVQGGDRLSLEQIDAIAGWNRPFVFQAIK